MKRISQKRAALMRSVKEARAEFLNEFPTCWVCGSSFRVACHEIAKGIHREQALSERCTWMAACADCNCGVLNDYTIWPLSRQLAAKFVYDAEHFDLSKFNEVRDRANDAITISEVSRWLTVEEI